MLQRFVYNRYRAYRRRRRDPVRELVGPRPLPALSGRDTGRGLVAALRRVDEIVDAMPVRAQAVMVAAIITACTFGVGGGVHVGIQWEETRQEDRIEAEFSKANTEFWALADAYTAAYDEEMRDRGYSQEQIDRARWASLFGENELPVPRETDTLEIRAAFNEAGGRWDALLDAQTDN